MAEMDDDEKVEKLGESAPTFTAYHSSLTGILSSSYPCSLPEVPPERQWQSEEGLILREWLQLQVN